MTQPTRIRAASKDGITEVRILMAHPMETGLRKDSSGQLVPSHYITDLTVQHAGRVVLSAQLSASIAANPYVAFKFKGGAKGDRLTVAWIDSHGAKRSDEADIG